MSVRAVRPRLFAVVLVLAVALPGCTEATSSSSSPREERTSGGSAPRSGTQEPARSAAIISSNVRANAPVTVDTAVAVDVADGTLTSVVLRSGGAAKPLLGSFDADRSRWVAEQRLEPATRYVLSSRAVDADGLATTRRTSFATERLPLHRQTYASITPLEGETVGVGMPVIVSFDVPVTDRAEFERHMTVTAKPATVGTWRWLSSTEAHWRPRAYWRPGTRVDVHVAVNSLAAGNGVYGQVDRHVSFTIGQSVVMRPNVTTDRMKVYVDGRLARTVRITGGKPGFETRGGVKLIVEKFESRHMDAATVGIAPGDPEYYNIPDVQYAQRVTFSGEFLHAAPWSVSSQGVRNVSHGCVGMSPADGRWLFEITHRGDPVEVRGSERPLEDGNGWTDWNLAFAEYRTGSAL